MRDHSVGTAILSLTAPGTSILTGKAASRLARSVNEEAAKIRDSDPLAFGFFAALPPIIDNENGDNTADVLEEIAFSLDKLHADGVTLFTSYGPDNVYLGHEAIKPIWEALSARKAAVFIHPTDVQQTGTHTTNTAGVKAEAPKIPQFVIDFPHETARTAVDLILNGYIRQYSGCKIILSHAGGTLPYIAHRAAHLLADYPIRNKTAEEFLDDARSFYYDTALSANHYSLSLLRKFAKEDHILFGTDFPYAPVKTIGTNVGWLEEAEVKWSKQQIEMLRRGNALRLFPRFERGHHGL